MYSTKFLDNLSLNEEVRNTEEKKSFKRLSFEDRQRIEKMLSAGERITKIANEVGFSRNTIYEEIKRGGQPYRALHGQLNKK